MFLVKILHSQSIKTHNFAADITCFHDTENYDYCADNSDQALIKGSNNFFEKLWKGPAKSKVSLSDKKKLFSFF